ncbi:hypothetical protein [Paraburkholderia hospita]|jgi:hypothetical protein|nr:hypothetical protein [Paraburkholderia hospita]SKD04802.1 hypothetical protein SAMN05446934_9438 [Paraburkholderia hospita]
MAKGQLRGNREVKKPKQPKKPSPVSLPSGAARLRETPSVADTHKKH